LTESAVTVKLHFDMDLVSDRQRQFEEYLRDGITAAKNGQRKLAWSLLNRASYLNNTDARPYMWLSRIAADPKERIGYLELASGLDPTDSAIRHELALLNGKIDPKELIPEGVERIKPPEVDEVQAEGHAFLCPRCGGRMTFEVVPELMTCEYCGYQEGEKRKSKHTSRSLAELADESEQEMDFILPTIAGHRWAQADQQLSCERCGALSLLPAGQKTLQCPYCGSNQVIWANSAKSLIEPQLIGLMKVDQAQAKQLAHRWLGRGFFSPDTLISGSVAMQLRPGYYSFWTYDGMVEVAWSCEVANRDEEFWGQADDKAYDWERVSGKERRFFDDVLVPGVKALDLEKVDALEPFDLKNLEAYDPKYLAGWPAVVYNRPLSEASLLAREKILWKMRPKNFEVIEPGRIKRNVSIGSHRWGGLTFKHILLPLWIGQYRFQGKIYSIMVNGQTGVVVGDRPSDKVKIVFTIMTGALFLVLIFVFIFLLSESNIF
jgi:ribosomal protein L37E